MPKHIVEGVTAVSLSATMMSGTNISGSSVSGSSGSFHNLNLSGSALYPMAFGGLALQPATASAGGVNEVSMSLTSGTFSVVSASVSMSVMPQFGVSASVQDGRIYIQRDGAYRCFSNIAVEAIGNPATWNCHLAIFVTGTEDPRWTTAMDMVKDTSVMLAVDGIIPLFSGNYIETRLRPSADVPTLDVHHMQFTAIRLGNIP